MFRNHFIITVRSLFKRKGYALLNILGLAIGIGCCLLIFQYVSYEKSYDNFQTNGKQIVRLRLDQYKQGELQWQSATSYPGIAPTLKRDFPEVENYCRLHVWTGIFANTQNNKKFNETKGYYADSSTINMLGTKLLKGNTANALSEPNEMIISESMAKKYFGNEDAMGKRVHAYTSDAPSNLSYIITGVFKDYPHNAHLAINYLVSYATLEEEIRMDGDTTDAANTSFGWYDFYTYLQLKPGTDYKNFEAKLPAFCNKYINSQQWNKTNNVKNWLYAIPLADIHLYSNYNQEAEPNGNGQSVFFIFLIGIFIMGIAWINYINLSTARSVERAKEVGVRKVLGAGRNNLIQQFMLESLLLNFISVVIGITAAYLSSPMFNVMMGRDVINVFYISQNYWMLFAGIFIFGTLLSGLYPALVLSGYKAAVVLKGVFKNSSGGLILRKSLIVFQFAISVILIAGTIIVYQQVKYMRSGKLGININETLVLNGAHSMNDSAYQNTYQPFKNELLQLPSVKSISGASAVPGQEIFWTTGVKQLHNSGASTASTLYLLGVDYDFIPQFQLKLLAGRNFSKDFPADRQAAIINEQSLSLLGFKNAQDALNKKLALGRSDTLTIAGVVQNFHHLGLQRTIDPQLMLLNRNTKNYCAVKLQSANMRQNVAAIEKIWNKYFPNDPFNYFFLDDFYNKQYKADEQFGKIFSLFAFLAILIACLGLLGLSSYNILQKTKEIGIRKVLGASVKNVVYVLSKDFLILIVIAFVFAVPAAWWIMHAWLQDFAYRINISWIVFLVAGFIAVAIALFTIIFQSIKAALANPVRSLRTE